MANISRVEEPEFKLSLERNVRRNSTIEEKVVFVWKPKEKKLVKEVRIRESLNRPVLYSKV